jgi:uncharacterized RDD family membrane protein YckC
VTAGLFFRRLLAGLFDLLALSIALLVLSVVAGTLLATGEASDSVKQTLAYWLPRLMLVLLPWLYFARLERGGKAYTFGKATLGIQVSDTAGGPLGFARAALRYPLKLLLCWSLPLAAFGQPTLYDRILGARVDRRAD